MAATISNLTPFKKGDPRTIECARKGGLACVNKYRQHWGYLKELKKQKRITPKDMKRIIEIMDDPDVSVADLYLFADELKNKPGTSTQTLINLMDKFIALHKLRHGEKLQIETKNVNVNIDVTKEEFDGLCSRFGQGKSVYDVVDREDNKSETT